MQLPRKRGVSAAVRIVVRPPTAPAKRGVFTSIANALSGCETHGLREDSRGVGIRHGVADDSPRSCRIPSPIRRPATRAEYTVGTSPRRYARDVYRRSGAEERTRTSTSLRTHEPESCASANSATSAQEEWGGILVALHPVKAGSGRHRLCRELLSAVQRDRQHEPLHRQSAPRPVDQTLRIETGQ